MRFLASAAFALGASLATAETQHASPDTPPEALRKLARSLFPGDVLLLAPGTYPGPLIVSGTGTAGNPIRIRGSRGTVISGGGGKKGGAVVALRGDFIHLENMAITGGGDTALWRGLYIVGDRCRASNVEVSEIPANGIHISDASGSATLERVRVHHCGGGSRAHQIYAASDIARYRDAVFRMVACTVADGNGGNNVKSRARRTEILDCDISGAAFHELDLVGPDLEAHPKAPPGTQSALVRGNRITKLPGSQGAVARVGSDSLVASMGTYTFEHNRIAILSSKPKRPVLIRVHRAIREIRFTANTVTTAHDGPVNLFENRWSSRSGTFVSEANIFPPGSR